MKGVIRSIKNEINNYDEGERLVRELTSNERTPPSTQMLIKLKIMLQDQYQFPTVVRMLFKRLKDYNNIRHVEKSLICVEYLIKNADRKFVRYCQMDKKSISKLTRYRYILGNNNGVPVDYGGNIRKRAKRITDLLDNDEKLRKERAKAQGYSMQFKHGQKNNKNKQSQQRQKKSSTKTKSSNSSYSSQQQSSSQKKKKKKKKKTKKKKEETATNESQQPQYESFIDVPPDNNNNTNGQQQQRPNKGNSDDLLTGNWWQQEEEQTFDGNDEEFGWFQSGDHDVHREQQSGVGDDGGAFGFGNDDDFEDEIKEDYDDLNPESWMTSLTAMDNVLDGNIQKKDPNKRNTKGTSMAQMASSTSSSSKQPIPNSFGTDDFFKNNSTDNNNNNINNNQNNDNNQNNNDFDPFGLDNNNKNASSSNNITSLYGNNKQNNNNMGFNNNNSGNFGYQGKSVMSDPYNNDPFAGIGSGGNTGAPQPAKYVPRQKQSDPFAQFAAMK